MTDRPPQGYFHRSAVNDPDPRIARALAPDEERRVRRRDREWAEGFRRTDEHMKAHAETQCQADIDRSRLLATLDEARASGSTSSERLREALAEILRFSEYPVKELGPSWVRRIRDIARSALSDSPVPTPSEDGSR